MTDDDTRTNIRRLERVVEANRKESTDKHAATRLEVEGVRQEVRHGHEERRAMHQENRARLDRQDRELHEQSRKLDVLVARLDTEEKTETKIKTLAERKREFWIKLIAIAVAVPAAATTVWAFVKQFFAHKP